jgi:hypothetical protein
MPYRKPLVKGIRGFRFRNCERGEGHDGEIDGIVSGNAPVEGVLAVTLLTIDDAAEV